MVEAELTGFSSCREDGGEREGEESNGELRIFFSLIRVPNNSLSGKQSSQREMKFLMWKL